MATEYADLTLKIDSEQAAKASRNVDDLGDSAERTERKTDGLGKSSKTASGKISGLKAAAGAAAIAIAGMVGSQVIDMHAQFTSSISELSAITGATGQSLAYFSEQAREMGATTTLSAQQAAEGFKLIASAMPQLLENSSALTAVTKEAIALAEASGITLPEAAAALGNSLNQFSAGADQAGRYINVLAAGAQKGASEITETTAALKQAGVVASGAGVSFEETNAAIQVLAASALKGAEGGTALRNVILNLSTQSEKKFNPEIVGLSQALRNLGAANLSTAEKAKLFGKENKAAGDILIQNADKLDDMTTAITGTSTAYDQAATRTDNLTGDVASMKSAWSDVALELGERFDPALRATTQFLTKSANFVKQLVMEITDLGDMLGAYAAAASAVASFDLDAAKDILKAREEERASLDEKIRKLWEVKAVTEEIKNLETGEGGAATAQVDKPVDKPKDEDTEKKASKKVQAAQDDMDLLLDLFEQEEELNAQMQAQREAGYAVQAQAHAKMEESLTQKAKDEADKRNQYEKMSTQQKASLWMGSATTLFGALSSMGKAHNQKELKRQKMLARLEIGINLASAIMKAYSQLGPIGGTAATVGLVAVAAKQNAAVSQMSIGGGGTPQAPGSVYSGGANGYTGGPSFDSSIPQQQESSKGRQINIYTNVSGSVVAEDLDAIIVESLKKSDSIDAINFNIVDGGEKIEVTTQ